MNYSQQHRDRSWDPLLDGIGVGVGIGVLALAGAACAVLTAGACLVPLAALSGIGGDLALTAVITADAATAVAGGLAAAGAGTLAAETLANEARSAADGTTAAAVGDDLLRPGPWAGPSVPSSAQGKATQAERDLLQAIGDEGGCHSCGTLIPGTRSGNWIPDHQPPSRLADGRAQVLFPHCQSCSNAQGLYIINLIRRGKL